MSSWVGRRAGSAKAQATSMYLFAYYLGSSIAGAAGGLCYAASGWPGVVVVRGRFSWGSACCSLGGYIT